KQNISTPEEEHIREFNTAWTGMLTRIVDSFSRQEKSIFDSLRTDHQREGFLIIRAFAGAAKFNGESDFEISQSSLADRLSVTPSGAAIVIACLSDRRVLTCTRPPKRHKYCGRYRWRYQAPPTSSQNSPSKPKGECRRG